jgi:hypothetical protein
MTSKLVRAALVGLLIAAGATLGAGAARANVSHTPVATACPASYVSRLHTL